MPSSPRAWARSREPPHSLHRRKRAGARPECVPAPRARAREVPVTERAVGDHGDAMPLAPPEHGVLDRALFQVVQDLIARERALAGDRAGLIEIGRVEVAHAPREDLSLALKLLERGERVFQRVLAT